MLVFYVRRQLVSGMPAKAVDEPCSVEFARTGHIMSVPNSVMMLSRALPLPFTWVLLTSLTGAKHARVPSASSRPATMS